MEEVLFNISALARLRSIDEFQYHLASQGAKDARRFDEGIIEAHIFQERWVYPGFSEPCGKYVLFTVDMGSLGTHDQGRFIPNIREQLTCPVTGLNNRQRLSATLLRQMASTFGKGLSIYLMEQITQFYHWSASNLYGCQIVGSEYLGPEFKSGSIINGVRHEDVNVLSFPDRSFDVIVSNDVFEHVPFPAESLAECARVLRPGGCMMMTVPFQSHQIENISRAELRNKEVFHLLPPQYHGNPLSPEGSLVFTDYGWDVLKLAKSSGFSDAWLDLFHAPALGHIGGGLQVFMLMK